MVATVPSPATITPRHVAVIMDANGRWAAARGLSRTQGHRAGTERIREVIRAFAERDVQYLTLFALSTENWRRPRREILGLMRILSRAIKREVQPLHEAGIRLRSIGHLDVLDPTLQRQINDAVALTQHNHGMTVCVAFNYGGRAEVVDAVRRIVDSGLPPEDITEQTISAHLDTDGLPDPDLIIRTGGDQRLSNFLIWQAAYAEYYSTPTYWPDFGETDVEDALAAFATRLRKFGGLPHNHPPRNGATTQNAD